MALPFGLPAFSGGAGSRSLEFVQQITQTNTGTTISIPGVAYGGKISSKRLIIVGITSKDNSATSDRNHLTLNWGGSFSRRATEAIVRSNTATTASVWSALVPGGSSATLTLTVSHTLTSLSIGTWAAQGASSGVPQGAGAVEFLAPERFPTVVGLPTTADGFVVGAFAQQDSSLALVRVRAQSGNAGLTENFDQAINNHHRCGLYSKQLVVTNAAEDFEGALANDSQNGCLAVATFF